jgi:hypothetical protein
MPSVMHDIPKDPTDWDVTVWGWVTLMVAFGGIYNWMMARRQGKKSTSIVSFLGELTLCEVVGIPVFMAIHGGTETAVGISVAIAIAAGHYGTRFVCKAEALANAYACKVLGVSQDELRKFEDDANQAANLAGCFDFGVAFTNGSPCPRWGRWRFVPATCGQSQTRSLPAAKPIRPCW